MARQAEGGDALVAVVHLQRGVLDAELVPQHLLDHDAAFVAVRVGGDQDVGRERREAGGHLPYVQLVEVGDAALAEELWADVDALVALPEVGRVTDVQVDYDDAPYGVQYWVVRWQCES